MRFQWPHNLLWLLAPALLFIAALQDKQRRRVAIEKFAGVFANRHLPAGTARRQNLKQGLALAALLFTTLALGGPRFGKRLKEVTRRGSDVLICVDVSTSMLAEDIVPSRIVKAKRELSELIEKLKGDRVGIIAFAGTAFLQCPLTTDLEAALMILDLLDPAAFPVPGTDIGSAIKLAVQTLPGRGRSAIVLLTDGEDFGKDTARAVREAADKGIRIYSIGFGTPGGELIKIRDDSGRVIGFKKDERGETVVSRLDEALLSSFARQTQGRYFPASNGDIEVDDLAQEIGGLKKENMGTEELSRLEHRFQIPLFLAFLCAFLEFLIPERPGLRIKFPLPMMGRGEHGVLPHWEGRRGGHRRVGMRGKILFPLIMLICLAATSVQAGFREDINRGNKRYQEGRWEEALDAYRSALEGRPGSSVASYNIGNVLYHTGKFEDALAELSRSTETFTEARLKAFAHYNRGNVYARMGEDSRAIEEYKKALLLNPSDEDAKFNLEFVRRNNPRRQNKSQSRSGKSAGKNKDKNKNERGGQEQKAGQNQNKDLKNPEALSKEDAERLLKAMQEQERQQFQSQSTHKPLEERSLQGKDW
jgi:Ca-activated chloride channel family protein